MADRKISELTALTSLATDDVLPIVDTSAVETKKVSVSTLDSRYARLGAANTFSANQTINGFIQGTAVQSSSTDATTNRLLKVGAFGLGAKGSNITDFTVDLEPGFYRYLEASATGAPGTGASFYGSCIINKTETGTLAIAWRQAIAPSANSRMWYGIRSSTTGSFTWVEVASAERGFEYGSNANGEYIRLFDGTQICWRLRTTTDAINTAYFGGYRSAAAVATFPIAFSAAPIAVATVLNQTAFGVEITSTSTTSAVLRWLSISSEASATRDANIIAIGRWA